MAQRAFIQKNIHTQLSLILEADDEFRTSSVNYKPQARRLPCYSASMMWR